MESKMTSTTLSGQLKALGFVLPEASAPGGNYVPWVLSNNMLYISGQTPRGPNEEKYIGKLGERFNVSEGQQAAISCLLNILAHVGNAIDDDISRIVRCVRLGGFVNSSPGFTEQPLVINGASDLLVRILGERGKHARAAVGVASLPRNVSVEIDAIFEIS